MKAWEPDYRNVVMAARNVEAPRVPLYEHLIAETTMEKILGREFLAYHAGDLADKRRFFNGYCAFFREMGYDTVSFERGIAPVMPGHGALGEHKPGVIKTREDFDRYPWEEIPDAFFEQHGLYFEALRLELPPGMKAVGGPGNGILECVEDIVGYMDLCYIRADDEELYDDIFRKVGEVSLAIWKRFLKEYGDMYCVLRFGDDMGYKSQTLIPPDDIRRNIIPAYRRIIQEVHACGKPFLLHSCGNIFDVMEDLIGTAGIDAKHSNEDQIAPFSVWVDRYGDRIGNFGGMDTDAVCRLDKAAMREYITDVFSNSRGHGGFAFGSGNSIPDYVPVDHYLAMVQIARELRGDA